MNRRTNILIIILALSSLQLITSKRLISQPKLYSYQENGESIKINDIKFQFYSLEKNKILSAIESDHYTKFSNKFLETHFTGDQESNDDLMVKVLLKKLDYPQNLTDIQIEEFTININSQGETYFQCHGYASFLRALQTFTNLIDEKGQIDELPIKIQDAPSYKYRGLMIDTSRHFLPVDVIQRTIRGMFLAKYNVLHWHIVDHESFPAILDGLEDVAEFGAYSKEQTYTKQIIEDMILYAQINGIMIIPEFDSPGHTQAWLQSPKYKELNACPDKLLDGQIDPTMDKSYDFVKKVFDEVQKVFPSNYFHIGGDEVSGGCYDERPSIKEFMQQHDIKDYIELQHYYNDKINEFIDKDKYRIFWFDADTKNLKYPNNSIIQFWGGSDQYHLLENYTEPVILSPGDYLYFDQGTGGWMGKSFGTFKPWYTVYEFKPGDSKFGQRLLGAECTLWSEVINYQSLDWKIWPRASALGLRLWNEPEELSLMDLVKSLVDTNKQLMKTGISPAAVSKEYCEIHIEECFKGRSIHDKEVLQLIEI